MTTRDPQVSEYLIRVLTNVGLSENQSAVYLACLKLGNASIWDIAEASGVKRTTCYVVMKDLMAKNIASESRDEKKATFSVISPDELWFSIKNKQNQFAEAISELNSLGSKTYSKPIIRMFEGKDGVERAYKLTLNMPEGSEILIYGNPNVAISYKEMIDEYIKQRVTKKIWARIILPDNDLAREVAKNDPAQFREVRFLPEDIFRQEAETDILPDSILHIAHSESRPFATMIESPTLAREERGRFEILWQRAAEKSDV